MTFRLLGSIEKSKSMCRHHLCCQVSRVLFPLLISLLTNSTLSFQLQLSSHYSTQPFSNVHNQAIHRIHEARVSRPTGDVTGLTAAGVMDVHLPPPLLSETNASLLQHQHHHLLLFLSTNTVQLPPLEAKDIVTTHVTGSNISSNIENNGNTRSRTWDLHSLTKAKATTKPETDEVVRVVDANTVKLKRNGLVTFAAVQTPSGYGSTDQNFRFPECMTKSPSSKVRQLLPAKTNVLVLFVDNNANSNGAGGSRPRPALVEVDVKGKGVLVNTE